MAHIIKSAATCRDRICKADWGQQHDCYVMAHEHKDAESAMIWDEFDTWHPDEARLHEKSYRADRKATMKANKNMGKITVKAKKPKPRRPDPLPLQKSIRLMPMADALNAADRPSHDYDPRYREAATAIAEAERAWIRNRLEKM